MKEFKINVNGLEVKAKYHSKDIETVFIPLLKRWTNIYKEKQKRIFVFLSAPAGCGKTTLALFLEALSKDIAEVETIQAIGMDGFHYPNAYLEAHTFEEDGIIVPLRKRKGNFATFDKESLKKKIIEGKTCDNFWPIYSREIHDPIQDKIQLNKNIILMEGNYLLLNKYGWEDLITYSDDHLFITCDEAMLKERLIGRKIAGGHSVEEANAFYEDSDKKNVQMILCHSHTANITLINKDGRYTIK